MQTSKLQLGSEMLPLWGTDSDTATYPEKARRYGVHGVPQVELLESPALVLWLLRGA